MNKVIVWLNEDIQGTYYVSGTYLEDGEPSSSAYPQKYLMLKQKLDNLFPHLPLMETKLKVAKIVRSYGYTPVIKVEP